MNVIVVCVLCDVAKLGSTMELTMMSAVLDKVGLRSWTRLRTR
jgi:hypothetical protein